MKKQSPINIVIKILLIYAIIGFVIYIITIIDSHNAVLIDNDLFVRA